MIDVVAVAGLVMAANLFIYKKILELQKDILISRFNIDQLEEKLNNHVGVFNAKRVVQKQGNMGRSSRSRVNSIRGNDRGRRNGPADSDGRSRTRNHRDTRIG